MTRPPRSPDSETDRPSGSMSAKPGAGEPGSRRGATPPAQAPRRPGVSGAAGGLALGEGLEQALQRVEAGRAAGPESPFFDGLHDRAVRGIRQMGAAARALLGELGEVGECAQDVRRIDVPETERANA